MLHRCVHEAGFSADGAEAHTAWPREQAALLDVPGRTDTSFHHHVRPAARERAVTRSSCLFPEQTRVFNFICAPRRVVPPGGAKERKQSGGLSCLLRLSAYFPRNLDQKNEPAGRDHGWSDREKQNRIEASVFTEWRRLKRCFSNKGARPGQTNRFARTCARTPSFTHAIASGQS